MLWIDCAPTIPIKPLLETNGCCIRMRGTQTVEVWGKNISDHFLITVDELDQFPVDIIYIPQINGEYLG